MTKKKGKITWFDADPFPPHIGFCPTRKLWEEFLDSQYITGKDRPEFNEGQAATCWHFPFTKPVPHIIITVNERFRPGNMYGRGEDFWDNAVGVMAHEATHAMRDLMHSIKEESPSAEFEAYMVQYITIKALKAFREHLNGHTIHSSRPKEPKVKS